MKFTYTVEVDVVDGDREDADAIYMALEDFSTGGTLAERITDSSVVETTPR